MGIDDWSATEAQNVALGKYDVSRGEAPDASTSEHARVLMAEIKALSDSVDERFDGFVGENVEVDGITIENNDGVLTVKDVAIDGDTTDLLTDKITEIEAAAETASGKASDAATAAEQAAASASAAVGSVSSAVDAANAAAAQASLAAQAAGRAQAGAALAESAVQAVVAQTNLNWQRSEKAGAVAIYPVPETALEPVVDFMFTETLSAEGDKGPDNPSTINGVSTLFIGQESENYAPVSNLSPNLSEYFTVDTDGWATLDYTNSNSYGSEINSNAAFLQYNFLPNAELDQNKTYLAIFCFDEASWSFLTPPPSDHSGVAWFITIGGDTSSSQIELENSIWINPNEDSPGYYSGSVVFTGTVDPTKLLKVTFNCRAQTVTHCRFRVSVVEVSNTYTVNLGGTFYGGSVDLATGLMTVTWEAVVIDGTETWYKHNDFSTEQVSVFYSTLNLPNNTMKEDMSVSTRFCSHFSYSSNTVVGTFSSWGTASRVYFKMDAANFPDVSDFTSWLASEFAAGHPVVLAYTKYAPATVQLTPQHIKALPQPDKYVPRLNTVYTNASAVQAGYAKSPIRSEYELTQAIIATEGGE